MPAPALVERSCRVGDTLAVVLDHVNGTDGPFCCGMGLIVSPDSLEVPRTHSGILALPRDDFSD